MMANKEQDSSSDPTPLFEQKSRLPGDVWELCKSKTYPGLLYYFNKATGEAVWSMDFEKHQAKKSLSDMLKRTIQFSHNYPEPQIPPSKSQYSKGSHSSSHVYNKQIINNKFSKNAYPWSTFGNLSFPNYLPHSISHQYAYSVPGVQFNQSAWAVPVNQPVFVGSSVSIPNNSQSFNLHHNKEISVQNTSVSLSDRFKNLESSVSQASRIIQIPRIDKSNPRYGKNFRRKLENSTTNINTEGTSNKLPHNDLRLMLVARRRKSVEVSENKNDYEESDHEYNDCEGDSEENQEIATKMIGLQVSSADLPEETSPKSPFKKKVTLDSLNIKNKPLEEQVNLDNMCEDSMDLHATQPQIDVTLLKRLSKPDDRSDVWFIVVDTCVLLSNLFFVNMLVKSDNKCRMMIPYRVHDELESQCSDMFRNHTLRTVGMAQRARRYLAKELSARTCVVAQTGLEAEDRNINCPTEDDDILNCCLQLSSQNYHVILLTNDENLIIKSRVCGIQSFTVKSLKKYLSGKEPERTFMPAPLKITITNNTKEDTVHKNRNLLVNDDNLNDECNKTDIPINYIIGQYCGSAQRRDIPHNISNKKSTFVDKDKYSASKFASKKTQDIECQTQDIVCQTQDIECQTQDIECQTSETIKRSMLKKTTLFIEKNDSNVDSVPKNDNINCNQSVNYNNSACIRTQGLQHQGFHKTSSVENYSQCKTKISLRRVKKGSCTETFGHVKNCVTNNINNNIGSSVTVNASDAQKNKKREIHLKRSNSNVLNDSSTVFTKKRPFKWRRRSNLFVNQNVNNKSNNATIEAKEPIPKLVLNELSQNKYRSQNIDINQACEPNVNNAHSISNQACEPNVNNAHSISNDDFIDDNSFQQSENTLDQMSNNLLETTASTSLHIPQDVINYASGTNSTDVDEVVFNKIQSSNMTESNSIGKNVIDEELTYNVDRQNDVKENFPFNITDKHIEEKVKMGCDEWLSRYVQAMEEVLTQILQQNSSVSENKLLPPPWTLHEAAECIKVKYKSHTSVTTPAYQLSFLLFTISDKTGKITSNLNPEQYMKLFNYGFNLVEALSEIHTDCEDITVAKASLHKLLDDIRDPNSLGFDTEVTAATEDILDESTSNQSIEKDGTDVNMMKQIKFPSKTLNNVPDMEKNQKKIFKVSGSDQEIWKNTNDFHIISKEQFNSKDTNDRILENNNTENDVTGKGQPKLSDIKRTINVYNKDNNTFNGKPPEYIKPIEKTQTEVPTVQPKIIRNFTGIPDFEKRLNEKRKSTSHNYSGLLDMDYELEKEDEYLDDEYENECSDEFITDQPDSLHDVTKNLSSQKEQNDESVNQRTHAQQVDAIVFKKPIDVNKQNEKMKEYKNIEMNINTFFREIKETFLQIYTYCQEVLKEINHSTTMTSLRKQEIYELTENTHKHLDNLTKNLKTILRREMEDGDNSIQSHIKRFILKNWSVNEEQNMTYREIIVKCLEQASIFSEVLIDITSACKA